MVAKDTIPGLTFVSSFQSKGIRSFLVGDCTSSAVSRVTEISKNGKIFRSVSLTFSLFQQCVNFYINSGLKVWWPLNFLLQVQSQKLDSFVIGTQSKAHSWQPISLVLGKWKWNHEWKFPRKSQQCAVIEQRIPNPWTSCHTKAVKRRKQKNVFVVLPWFVLLLTFEKSRDMWKSWKPGAQNRINTVTRFHLMRKLWSAQFPLVPSNSMRA